MHHDILDNRYHMIINYNYYEQKIILLKNIIDRTVFLQYIHILLPR